MAQAKEPLPKVDILPGRFVPRQGHKARDHAVYSTAAPFEVAVTVGERWSYVELRDTEGDRMRIVSVVQGNDRQYVRQAEAIAKGIVSALPEAAAPSAIALVTRLADVRQARIAECETEIENGERFSDRHAEEAYTASLERGALLKTRAIIRREAAK